MRCWPTAGPFGDICQGFCLIRSMSSWLQAKAEGVVFAACHIALRAQALDPKDLIEKTLVVPAGVIELAQKQQAGFAYIKP